MDILYFMNIHIYLFVFYKFFLLNFVLVSIAKKKVLNNSLYVFTLNLFYYLFLSITSCPDLLDRATESGCSRWLSCQL